MHPDLLRAPVTIDPAYGPAAFLGHRGPCDDCDLAGEADHRIANHLSLLAGMVRLKSAELLHRDAISRGDVELVIDGICSQIEVIGRLHRAMTTDRGADCDLCEYVHEVCAALEGVSHGRTQIIEDLAGPCMVPSGQVIPIAQIVSEVLTNAIKHAGGPGGAGIILARCRNSDDGALQVEISDNGAGLPQRFDPAVDGGFGFRLLHALGRQLGALMAFDSSDCGLRFRFTMPRTS